MRGLLNLFRSILPEPIERYSQELYERLPYELRYGPIYRTTRRLLQESQYWPEEQLNQYQLEQLKNLVRHAIEHVPFYRERYKSEGIVPEEITSLDHIRLLPLVSKQDLVDSIDRIKAENFSPRQFQYHTTGGSTGRPVGLYWEANRTVPMERAFMQRQFSWIGYDPEKDRTAVLRGIPPAGGQNYEIIGKNTLRLSSYRLTPAILDEYIQLINDFQPTALQAYPSSALLLARHMIDKGIHSLSTIRIVLCGSEQLFDWQRSFLESTFNCRVYSWYGQSEYVSLAGECEYSSEYHFYSEYGVTEIIKGDLNPAERGETGEIVATGFLNFAFPLIRYKTGDLATLSIKDHCKCGRAYLRCSKIEGRVQEMILSNEGNAISMTAINMHNDIFDNVYQFQFYQDTPGKLILNIIRKAAYNIHDEQKIRKGLYEKLGDQFTLDICYVSEVQQTHRGKTGFLIQKIPAETFKGIINP